MSIKDITDYVRQTPGNTNPSVIRSMVEREVENGQKDVVKYTPQNLTDEQKAQARENIGAGVGAIPAIELANVPNVGDTIILTEQEIQQVQTALNAGNYCIFYIASILQCVVARKIDDSNVFGSVISYPGLPGGQAILLVGTDDGETYMCTWMEEL